MASRETENKNMLGLYDKGLSVRKISNIMGISRSSVKYRLINELKINYVPSRIFSEDWKRKIKLARAKQEPPCRGMLFSKSHKQSISDSKKGKTSDAIIAFHSSKGYKEKCSMAKRGEKCYLWKGGITPITKKLRDSFRYREWRKQVFDRDNYTCQKCGTRNGNGKHVNFHPHHIYPFEFSEIINYLKDKVGINRLYDVAINYELLWNPCIGKTYCIACHKETKTWGINQYMKGLKTCV